MNLEKQLKDELDLIVCQEELICCQKSKVDWIQVGDWNTTFLHTKTIHRRKKNLIELLKNDESEWEANQEKLNMLACDFFQKLYTLESHSMAVYHVKGKFPIISSATL